MQQKSWGEILKMPLGSVARVPLDAIAGTVAGGNVDQIINFKASSGTYAVDILIRNLDAVAALNYRLNNVDGQVMVLDAGAEIGYSSTLFDKIRVTGNAATGTWQVQALALPRELLYK